MWNRELDWSIQSNHCLLCSLRWLMEVRRDWMKRIWVNDDVSEIMRCVNNKMFLYDYDMLIYAFSDQKCGSCETKTTTPWFGQIITHFCPKYLWQKLSRLNDTNASELQLYFMNDHNMRIIKQLIWSWYNGKYFARQQCCSLLSRDHNSLV